MLKRAALAGALLIGLSGCSSPEPGQDASFNEVSDGSIRTDPRADLAGIRICCGHPGDRGNSVGVGQHCITISDCLNNTKAKICATLFMPEYSFCTARCDPGRDPLPQCGEDATCLCLADEGCGCLPTACRKETAPLGCFP
jgi:hypothetical protein